MKGLDRSIYEISVLYDFRLFAYSTSFSNDDFSSFSTFDHAGGETAKKCITNFKIKMSHLSPRCFKQEL